MAKFRLKMALVWQRRKVKFSGKREGLVFLVPGRPKPLALGLMLGFIFLSLHPLWGDVKTGTPNPVKKKALTLEPAARLLEDSLLFQKGVLGTITSIVPLRFHPDSQPGLLVAGHYGAAYLSGNGKLRSAVKFEREGYRMVPVNLEGGYAFMNRGGDRQQVGLVDSAGREVWRYGLGMDPVPNDMAAGDLDGDGRPEFVVGMSGEDGLLLLDAAGKEKWRQPESHVWHVEVLDLDRDGKTEIVHTNADGKVRIRDANGKLIREITYNTFVILFSLCRWPKTDGDWVLINNSRLEGIQLLDFSGNVVAKFIPPVKGLRVFGTPVRLSATEKPCFALLVCDGVPRHDTHLYLYDAKGEIVFERRFLTPQATLLSVPDDTLGTEKLLVGESEGAVWQIRLTPVKSSKGN